MKDTTGHGWAVWIGLSGSAVRTRSLAPLLALALLGVSLSGCALGRDVVPVAPLASVTQPGASPVGTAPAKIAVVSDKRVFEAAPRDPSIPSLESAADIGNPAITAKAFGRKRGGFGKAFGDIVLPEGQTVAGLVRDVTRKVLQDKGYRVVDETSPDYAAAPAVNVEIQELWTWFTPGMFAVSVECRVKLQASGDLVAGTSPSVVTGYAITKGAIATDSDYAAVLTQALGDLATHLKEQIKSPS